MLAVTTDLSFRTRAANAASALLSGTRVAWDALRNRYEGVQRSTERSRITAPVQHVRLDITRFTRIELVRKSRYFEKNSELYNKLADVWEQYTVGTGLQFFPTSSDTNWNPIAALTWESWKPMADVSSRFGFDNLQGVISRATFIDGEVFLLLTRDLSSNRPRFQLIEGNFCETPPQQQGREGKSIVDGVEVDPNGRPVGYWFQMDTNSFRYFDAWQVIHIFEPSRPGQVRGIPYIACAINTLHDMDDLALLEMRHAKVVAQNSLIVKTANGDLPANMRANYVSEKFGNGQVASAPGVTDEQRREFYQSGTGARVNVAMHGDDISEFVSDRPSVATREYWRILAEKVCAGVGIPYILVYPDSMQGTVYRGALDCANAFFRSKSSVFATHFQRLYEFVINAEASFVPGLAKRPVDWRKTSYRAPRAVNVDIGRNSAARIAELAAGFTTWTGVAAELGLDGRQLLTEKADELVFIRNLATPRQLKPEQIAASGLPSADTTEPEPKDEQ